MEAVPSKDWEEDVGDLERERKSGGNTAYVRHHEKTLADLLPRTLEVFTKYVEKTCRPFPQVCSGAVDGSKKFLPYRGKADNLPQFGKSIRVSIVTNDGPPKLGSSREFQPIQPAVVPGMQNLPRLLPATDDVRKPVERREVDKSEDGSTGADWVHVSSASEAKDTRESMLVKNSDERGHGVEGAIDI